MLIPFDHIHIILFIICIVIAVIISVVSYFRLERDKIFQSIIFGIAFLFAGSPIIVMLFPKIIPTLVIVETVDNYPKAKPYYIFFGYQSEHGFCLSIISTRCVIQNKTNIPLVFYEDYYRRRLMLNTEQEPAYICDSVKIAPNESAIVCNTPDYYFQKPTSILSRDKSTIEYKYFLDVDRDGVKHNN